TAFGTAQQPRPIGLWTVILALFLASVCADADVITGAHDQVGLVRLLALYRKRGERDADFVVSGNCVSNFWPESSNDRGPKLSRFGPHKEFERHQANPLHILPSAAPTDRYGVNAAAQSGRLCTTGSGFTGLS